MRFLSIAVLVSTAHGFVPMPSKHMSSLVTKSTASTDETAAETIPSKKTMFSSFADEQALFQQSKFPIPPNELMERAKEVLSPSVGIGTKDGGACLADDFEFVAAVVGPIGKEEYLDALGNFDLERSFDIQPNFFGMSVDPYQPNRVWFFNRLQATHTGDFMGAAPTQQAIEYPPQIQHLDFNEEGKVKEYGFYTADRRIGNTGGLGGAFGFMYAVGKPLPIPECQPYKPSFRFRLLQMVGGLLRKFKK